MKPSSVIPEFLHLLTFGRDVYSCMFSVDVHGTCLHAMTFHLDVYHAVIPIHGASVHVC